MKGEGGMEKKGRGRMGKTGRKGRKGEGLAEDVAQSIATAN